MRGLTVNQKALIAGRIFGASTFCELMLAAPLRIWTGVGPLTVDGFTWQGVGEFGAVDGLESSRELVASSISVSLSGLPADALTPGVIQQTRTEIYQGKELNIYVGFFDPTTNLIVDNLVPVWTGVADVLSFKIAEEITANLSGEHYNSRLRRANGARATTQNHMQRLGGTVDYFFEPQNRLMGRASVLV